MADMRDVYSSHVDAIGYEGDTLIVQWSSGKVSHYENVPPDVADEVMNSPSIGSALRQSIKGTYRHRYA
jgi:hypothetical protein